MWQALRFSDASIFCNADQGAEIYKRPLHILEFPQPPPIHGDVVSIRCELVDQAALAGDDLRARTDAFFGIFQVT